MSNQEEHGGGGEEEQIKEEQGKGKEHSATRENGN
jgi:hypothetical protein